ncbi:RNA-binding protein 34-like [Penaeus indicus]|uniref:RNA-binding protein 34-like n=1 Tax=Penaeus indicus TaxID=29960 RepID=UPI00300CCDFF
MVSVTKMSKQVPPKPVSKKKKMKKTQAKKATNEKPIDAVVDGSLEKAASDSRMGKKVAPKTVPKKKKMKKTPVKKAVNEEPADEVINDGLEKQENGSTNDNEQQLENKEKDQASPKKNGKAKKNKKKKMNKSLETAQEASQENQDADEERNDDKMQIENSEAKPQNKKKRKSDSQDTAENKGGVKTNKKKKMKKSVNTTEKPLEENKEADDEKDDDEEDKDEQPTTKGMSDEEKEEIDRRTIFVGNVDIKAKRSALRKIFKEYGEIETIRFRNAAVADPNESKRVAMIKRHFHESQVSIIVYIRFKTEESAVAALSANNKILKERHLQVDRVTGSRKVDPKCSVFIGNLPFDANEEEVREIFLDCGAIENVRIVRDKELGSGKGFGYVNFQSPDAVELALKISGTLLRKRQLRVKRYLMKEQVEKRQKIMEKKTQLNPKKMRLNFMAKNKQGGKKSSTSFTGEKFKAKENIKKKKKFTKDEKKKFAISKKLSGSN